MEDRFYDRIAKKGAAVIYHSHMEKKLADEKSGPIMTDFQVKVAREKEAEK